MGLRLRIKLNTIKYAIPMAFFMAALPSSSHAECYVDSDKFTGVTNKWCGAWGTHGNQLGGMWGVDPIPLLTTLEDGTEVWTIKLIYKQTDWLFIPQNAKMILIFDTGERVTITSPNGSLSDRTTEYDRYNGNTVKEVALFAAGKELIEKMSKAKQIEFSLYGDRGRVERKLEKYNLEHYIDFIKYTQK